MKAGIMFTGTGPILIVTSYDSLTAPQLLEKLKSKGIKKFIAYEVSIEEAQDKYGQHYRMVMGDLHQSDDLRVLDFDGHHVFYNFSFKELGEPIYHESRD